MIVSSWFLIIVTVFVCNTAEEHKTNKLIPESRHNIIKMSSSKAYEQDGEEAREIAKSIPYFPFKNIDKFYDIGGFLAKPDVFQKIIDIFAARYAEIGIDVVAGLDARGFILGPPIALALKVCYAFVIYSLKYWNIVFRVFIYISSFPMIQKPFIMMRKKGKMPNTVESPPYETEYGSRSGLCVQRDAIKSGDRVLIIDDLVATGGTLSAGIELVHMFGGTVVECACVVELKFFIPSRKAMFEATGMGHVPVWGLISEDVLSNEAKLPEGYVDDGEDH